MENYKNYKDFVDKILKNKEPAIQIKPEIEEEEEENSLSDTGFITEPKDQKRNQRRLKSQKEIDLDSKLADP
jgi:hypothetical protein